MAMNTLEQELKKCAQTAEQGYKLAKENYSKLHESLQEEQQTIREAHRKRDNVERLGDRNADKLFEQQMKDIERLQQTDKAVLDNINLLHKEQKEFSVLVFGRTMAGKSTMMEVLTHGDGSSMGKGAQRTTRDVREYHWNGLKVIDVPGICSFDGDEDDRLALDAAKSADMILFMLTDDAPQRGEAEKLAELRKYGKPILGVMNVKMAVNLGQNRKLVLRNLQKKIADTSKVESIREQFCEYAKDFGQDWSQIPFVHAHLLSAFLAQSKCSGTEATELYNASNMTVVEQFILDAVRSNGSFWRTKNFINSIAVPMYDTMHQFFKHSADNLRQAIVYYNKRNELHEWGEAFWEYGNKMIEQEADNLAEFIFKKNLNEFVEDHYEDEDAGENWAYFLENAGIEEALQNMLEGLNDECTEKLQEMNDELQQDIRFSFGGANIDTSISMEGISDMKSIVQLGVGGLGIAAAVGVALGPIGWAALGIGALFSIFGDSREEKIREAKNKLRSALFEATKPVYEKYLEVMDDTFTKMYNERVVGFMNQLHSMGNLLLDLSNSQLHLASNLSKQYLNLNYNLVLEADEFVGNNIFQRTKPRDICRIPGQEIVIVLPEGDSLYEQQRKSLENTLGEKVVVLTGDDEWFKDEELVQQILETPRIQVAFDDDGPNVYIPFNKLYKAEQNKLPLVQQLTGCLLLDMPTRN